MHPPRIIASVLGADYMHLADEMVDLEMAGVDAIQWDVMDGSFVPPITFGADIVAAARPLTRLPFEAHLMVVHPETSVHDYIDAGCGTVIVHVEAASNMLDLLGMIKGAGALAGVALNPATPLVVIDDIWEEIDLLVLMTVNPGYAGQSYIPEVEEKVAAARRLIDERGLTARIEVDGGIKRHTIAGARAAGAEDFIAGSAILDHPGGKAEAVRELRAALGS